MNIGGATFTAYYTNDIDCFKKLGEKMLPKITSSYLYV